MLTVSDIQINITVYDFDNPATELFEYVSIVVPRETEELIYKKKRYIVQTVEYEIISINRLDYSATACRYANVYVRKFEDNA